jgi:hypothetical protein
MCEPIINARSMERLSLSSAKEHVAPVTAQGDGESDEKELFLLQQQLHDKNTLLRELTDQNSASRQVLSRLEHRNTALTAELHYLTQLILREGENLSIPVEEVYIPQQVLLDTDIPLRFFFSLISTHHSVFFAFPMGAVFYRVCIGRT